MIADEKMFADVADLLINLSGLMIFLVFSNDVFNGKGSDLAR